MSRKLKVIADKKYVRSIEPINPGSRRLTWKKGESRHCELSHVVHLKPNPSGVIAEFHLTPRGAAESQRRDRKEKREQRKYERYLKSAQFRREQDRAWKEFVLS